MHIDKEEALKNLVDSFVNGNHEAFAAIATMVHADILNIAYRYLGNAEDAKDVLQEVLIKMHRSLQSFRNASRFSTWMYRITVNAAVDALRKRKSLFNVATRYLKEAKEKMAFTEAPNVKSKEIFIKAVVQELPLRQKNAFILKHYQGLTIREISKSLGCSQSSIKTHLGRATCTIRKKMEEKV
ncbi:MAG: RNA polymerase sigma factor [Candidatus Omnitrophica bacterium]|nr:RNA polymerase sigma factor [Candidatus Omnitrophota bacterium]